MLIGLSAGPDARNRRDRGCTPWTVPCSMPCRRSHDRSRRRWSSPWEARAARNAGACRCRAVARPARSASWRYLPILYLCRLAAGEEMVEQPLAVGEGSTERLELGRRYRKQRQRKLHDVVERQHDAHRSADALAPALDRAACHWSLITPLTARHSVGRISASCAIRTEWSAASISRRQ